MILHVTSGLASRCFCVYQAIILCKKYNDNLVIIWPVSWDCDIGFLDVFSKKILDNKKIKFYNFYEKKQSLKIFLKSGNLFNFCRELKHRIINKNILKKISKYELLDYYPSDSVGWDGEKYINWVEKCRSTFLSLYSKTHKVYIKVYSSILATSDLGNDIPRIQDIIKFKEKYNSFIDEFKKMENLDNYIGIHIRRTDHDVCIEKSKTSIFVDKINEILNDDCKMKFFLATDDISEEMQLKKIFGDRLFSLNNKTFGRDSKSGMISGILDLLCLSKSNYILGSSGSVFSNFAAQYGNVNLFVADNTVNGNWKLSYEAQV